MTTWKQPSRKQWPLMIAGLDLFPAGFCVHAATKIHGNLRRRGKPDNSHLWIVARHIPRLLGVTNLFDVLFNERGWKSGGKVEGRVGETPAGSGPRLIVGDVGAERWHRADRETRSVAGVTRYRVLDSNGVYRRVRLNSGEQQLV